MAKRLGATIMLVVLGVCTGLTACGDDPANEVASDGGAGGEASTPTAGKATAGSSSAGSANKAGNGGGGAGGAPIAAGGDGGAGGEVTSSGGAPGGASAGGAAGDGGGGGAPALTYSCGDNDISHTLCSALAASNCADEADCSDCVTMRDLDRSDYLECSTCLAEFDKFYQCGIDAFENGTPSEGIECVEGFGADLTFDCYPHLQTAMDCHDYLVGEGQGANPCPATWPLQ